MLSIQKILVLLSLFGAQALAAPTAWDGLSPRPAPGSKETIAPGQPTGTCEFNDHFIFDRYTVRGTNWNISESEFKNAIDSKGAATSSWKWTEGYENGVQVFKARYNLPIDMHSHSRAQLKKLVKPWAMKIKCRRTHAHNGAYGTNNLPPKDEDDITPEEKADA